MTFILTKPFKLSQYVIAIFTPLVIMLSLNSHAYADEETETYDGIVVEQAFVQTDQATPYPLLSLNISNFSSNDLTLMGISTEWFETTNLLIRMPNKGLVEVDTLSILQEETLNLDTSHIVIELRKLTRAIKEADKIEFKLLFANRTIPVLADIHISNSL